MVFLSTALSLYIDNQTELGYQIGVVLSFIGWFLATFAAGVGLWLLSKFTWSRFGLWAFFLAGPWFIALTLLRDASVAWVDQLAGLVVLLLAAAASVVIAARLADPRSCRSFFALLSTLFILVDGSRLVALDWSSLGPDDSVTALPTPGVGAAAPNIYHLLLDGFQGDIFTDLITDEMRGQLAGFVHFPSATATYSVTRWSVPSVFLGARYDFMSSQNDYLEAAFNGSSSLLWHLRQADYANVAFSRKLYPVAMDGFHRFTQHADNTGAAHFDNSPAFKQAWLYRYLPKAGRDWLAIRGLIISEADVDRFEAGTFLPESAPVESYLSFQQYLIDEESLPSSNRYTFIHLMIPHDPYVYDSSCSVNRREATVITQSQCALNQISALIERLKALDRFTQSTVLVHGDHGERFRLDDGNLVPHSFRSPSTLLLVKPPGRIDPLETSSHNVTLLDIAPTLIAAVGAREPDYEGVALLDDATLESRNTQRSYYVVQGERAMQRYVIADGNNLDLAETVALENVVDDLVETKMAEIPVWQVNRIFEAEDGALNPAVDIRSAIAGVSGKHISNGSVRFRFRVDEAGLYVMRARLVTPSGNNNSSFLRLDGGKSRNWNMGVSRTWQWQDSPIKWELEAGVHIVAMEYREPVFLDQVELRRVEAAGPGESKT